MKLSKTIPSRKKTVEFSWAYKYFMQCTTRYLEIRNGLHKSRRGSITSCDWCKRKLKSGEWFALAQPKPKQEGPKRNWVLCHTCADIIKAPDIPKKEVKP